MTWPRATLAGLVLAFSHGNSFIIQRIEGPNGTEITHASVAGAKQEMRTADCYKNHVPVLTSLC